MMTARSNCFTWADLLAAVSSAGAVVKVVRDYVATWTPEEIAALPEACRPPAKFLIPEDIVLYTFALVDYQLKRGADDAGVYRMAGFFTEATRRVTHHMSRPPHQAVANEAEPGA